MRWILFFAIAGCYFDVPEHTVGPAKPAGRRFVFVSGRDSQDHWSSPQIYLAAEGQPPVNLTNDAHSNSSPALSPDGARMVFVSWRDGGPGLYVMELASGDIHAITTGTGSIQSPRWSNTTIAYEAPANAPQTAVWLIGDDGASPHQLTSPAEHEHDDGGLAFIDHGQRIVFSRYDERTHDRDLYVVTVDGGRTRRLTESRDVSETAPVASHDGRLLAYRATPSAARGESIRIVSTADWSVVVEIPLPAPAARNVSGIDFTADDRGLVFGADAGDVGGSLQNLHGEIFAIDVDGTHLRRLTKNAAYDGQPAVIPGP